MTVIAYRDGVMAADTGVITGDMFVAHIKKITRTPDGGLCAAAGSSADAAAFARWCSGAMRTGDFPTVGSDFVGYLVTNGGEIRAYNHGGNFAVLETDYFATGSGYEVAMGAMDAGASAVEAATIAINRCTTCGGAVQALCLAA